MAAPQRVLAHVKKISDVLPVQLQFTQDSTATGTGSTCLIYKTQESLVDVLESKDDATSVYIWVEPDPTKLIISSCDRGPQDTPVRIKRPSFCPIHSMNAADHNKLAPETLSRGVDVGSVVLVETADEKLLLIRRAKELRTFPNLWVPPGGHMEQGEQIEEAGLRELQEETGLTVTKDMLHEPISILALWESSFPPKLSAGMPRRHHIVIYLHCKLKLPHTADQLQPLLKPDPREVGAVAWFERSLIKAIVAASEEATDSSQFDETGNVFSASTVAADGSMEAVSLPTAVLVSRATGGVADTERVSTGTKWALENWLSLMSKTINQT